MFLKNRMEVEVEIDTTEQTEMIVCHGKKKSTIRDPYNNLP